MAQEQPVPRIVIDCSVMAKWVLPAEDGSEQALDVLSDQQAGAVELHAPDILPSEIGSSMLRALRRQRIDQPTAEESIQTLLDVPVVVHPSSGLVSRAFEIALAENQRIYDCFYVALAEIIGAFFWTGDERLCNALALRHPQVRFIADYTRLRQG